MSQSLLEKYLNSVAGKKVVQKYPNFYGYWKIMSEGDGYSNKVLEIVKGELHDVIEYAVELPGFWTYGNGGTFVKIAVKEVNKKTIARRKELSSKIKELEEQLEVAKKELSVL